MKDLEILHWNGQVPDPETLAKIDRFAKECEIGENYDQACDQVYILKEAGEIVGVIALKQTLFSDGRTIPVWEHIIFAPHIQRTKKALYFLLNVEQRIFEEGFKTVLAFVAKQRVQMIEYALKFGFKEYDANEIAVFLMKNIQKRRE